MSQHTMMRSQRPDPSVPHVFAANTARESAGLSVYWLLFATWLSACTGSVGQSDSDFSAASSVQSDSADSSAIASSADANSGAGAVPGGGTGTQIASSTGLVESTASNPAAADSELLVGPPDLSVANMCTSATKRGSAHDAVRRLTRTELTRLLQTTFTSRFYAYDYPFTYFLYDYEGDIMRDYPADESDDPNEHFNPLHSEAAVSAWTEIADVIGSQVAWSDAERATYGGDCINLESLPEDCFRNFVAKLGRKLFRRPLTDEEVTEVLAEADDYKTNAGSALHTAVSYLLRSPYTVFHFALGAETDGDRVRLTDYEVAERLAFGLTEAPPDDELLDAAESGQLKTLEQVQAQAARLMQSDLARGRWRTFVDEWLRVYLAPVPPKSQKMPDWDHETDGLDASYRTEIFAFAQYAVWTKNGTFRDLMTLPIAFPAEKKLADIYQSQVPEKGQPVDAPDHPGLLLRAGLLASALDTTNPIVRGVLYMRRALCYPLPMPDPTIVATRLIELNKLDPKTLPTHEIVSQVTASPVCQSCHQYINPMGFSLEEYSPLGMSRTEQDYIGPDPGYGYKLWATFPLPGPQTLTVGELPAKAYNNAIEVIEAIADSQQAKTCMATRLFRAINRRPEQAADACAIAEVVNALAQDKPILEALSRSVANEDIFWRKNL